MTWLGIAILTVFSVALSLFMRLERRQPRQLPADIGQWQASDASLETGDGLLGDTERLERRQWLYEGGWLRPHRLVEQRRVRGTDGRILRTLPERVVTTWRGTFQRP